MVESDQEWWNTTVIAAIPRRISIDGSQVRLGGGAAATGCSDGCGYRGVVVDALAPFGEQPVTRVSTSQHATDSRADGSPCEGPEEWNRGGHR